MRIAVLSLFVSLEAGSDEGARSEHAHGTTSTEELVLS